MPNYPAAQKHIEITFAGTIAAAGAKDVLVTAFFDYRRDSEVPPINKANIDTVFQASLGDVMLLAMSSNFTQSANRIRKLYDSEDLNESFTQVGVGAIATDRLPTDSTVRYTLKTGIRGAYAMGNKQLFAVPEAHTTADILTGAGLALWQAVGAAMLAGFTDAAGNVWKLCVLSRKYSPSLDNPTNLYSNDVTSVVLNKNIGRLKRRRQTRVV